MSSHSQIAQPQHPPYIPTTWSLGGHNSKNPDVPITSVFLVLFILGAATHMTIFQLNRRRGHKFIFNGLLFGFCMARIVTMILRIASTCLPHNIRLGIAAQIFVAAGVVLVYIINLFLTQRIIRAQHPHLGWHKALDAFFYAVYVLIVLSLVLLITSVIQMFYTLSTETHRIDRDIQLYGGTFYAVVSFLPILLLTISLLIPRTSPIDKFGTRTEYRMRHAIAIVITGSTIICLGAAYRAGTNYLTPVPATRPLPSYFSKACFYIFNFTVEILVVYFYAFIRIDQRFHVPNGAKGAGSYAAGRQAMEQARVGKDTVEEPERNGSAELSTAGTEVDLEAQQRVKELA